MDVKDIRLKLKEFREYKRKASERMTRLEERIVRLERKEAESHANIQNIPQLYLTIEDLNERIKSLIEKH